MQIDRFEVIDEAGQGGFARVYKVLHPDTQETLALKWLLPQAEFPESARSSYAQFCQRFYDDATILKNYRTLSGVVGCFDVGRAEGRPFYTMELMEKSLAHDLGEVEGGKASVMDWQVLVGYMVQVLQVLDRVHPDVVHRDIKPGNVLLNGAEAKLSDFGSAKRDGRLLLIYTQTGRGLWTPYYSAPEQLTNSYVVDGRADLYSVGVILYRGLTGMYPQGERLREQKVAATLPVGLVDLIEQLIRQEPAQRPASAGGVLEILTGLLAPAISGHEIAGDVPVGQLVLSGNGLRYSLLFGNSFAVGRQANDERRDRQNDISFRSYGISNMHGVVEYVAGDGWYFEDNKWNATDVNGQPTDQHVLGRGDVVELWPPDRTLQPIVRLEVDMDATGAEDRLLLHCRERPTKVMREGAERWLELADGAETVSVYLLSASGEMSGARGLDALDFRCDDQGIYVRHRTDGDRVCVNGAPVDMHAVLAEGDVLAIGDGEWIVEQVATDRGAE